jgi:acetyl esterase/lipase
MKGITVKDMKPTNKQRQIFFGIIVCIFLSGLAVNTAAAEVRMQTYTYKRVGALEIKANVYRDDDEKVRPVIVWIHGGALIMGGRDGVSRLVKKMFLDAGYAIVSIDYRLAPETKLPAIIEDIEDAFKWIREKGPELFDIDSSKIAVLGGSAGGYLTLAAGYRVKPRPTALVAFWGYGDLIGDWYSKPSPHRRHQRSKMTEEKARMQVSGPAIANSKDRNGDGGAFYQFCRQRGIWPKEVSGWDPHKEAQKFYPFMPVKNVSKEYPPTLLIHGTKDTDVPYEQSVMMAEQFRKFHIDHEFITIAGGEHGLGGGDPEKIDEAYKKVFQFVHQRMTEKSPPMPTLSAPDKQ